MKQLLDIFGSFLSASFKIGMLIGLFMVLWVGCNIVTRQFPVKITNEQPNWDLVKPRNAM